MDYFEFVESKSKGKKEEKKKEQFKRLKVNEEWDIFMGRTSRENDLLTCKTAKPTDWWFHSRVFHGTHLVLRNYRKQEPNNELIILCSRIAAYYSKAKNSTNVPVDYTQIRYVTKPHGAASGYVIYKNQKTLFVTPISIRDAANYINENHERFMTT
jgi:predicted ribosome quality control (RQC) complex YloA/Tae2 family protein